MYTFSQSPRKTSPGCPDWSIPKGFMLSVISLAMLLGLHWLRKRKDIKTSDTLWKNLAIAFAFLLMTVPTGAQDPWWREMRAVQAQYSSPSTRPFQWWYTKRDEVICSLCTHCTALHSGSCQLMPSSIIWACPLPKLQTCWQITSRFTPCGARIAHSTWWTSFIPLHMWWMCDEMPLQSCTLAFQASSPSSLATPLIQSINFSAINLQLDRLHCPDGT